MSFADISKKSKDTLTKEFVETEVKEDAVVQKSNRSVYEIRTKSLAGTGFAFTVNRKADESVEGSLSVKKSYKAHAIDTEVVLAPASIKFVASQNGKIVDGAKVGLTVERDQEKEVFGGSVDVDYSAQGNTVNLKVAQDKKDQKRTASLSFARTQDSNVFGFSGKVNLQNPNGDFEAGIAAQRNAADSQVSLAVVAKKETKKDAEKPADLDVKASLNLWHEYSATSQFGAEAVVPVTGAGVKATTLRASIVHKLADDEVVRARLTVGGAQVPRAGFAYSTRLGAHTTLSAAADAALQDLVAKKLSTDSVFVGVKVALNAE